MSEGKVEVVHDEQADLIHIKGEDGSQVTMTYEEAAEVSLDLWAIEEVREQND